MTREEHLQFCNKCTNRQMNLQKGLICKLTNEKADFEGSCENFERDASVQEVTKPEVLDNTELLAALPVDLKSRLIPHQNLVYAVVGGFFLSIIGALLWAVITVAIQYQIGYMAVGVGLLVGMGVRFFGAGIEPIFGVVGGFFALLGCLLGNLFSQVGFIAAAESLSYLETLSLLDLEIILSIYQESFSIMDLLFYAIAIYEGYKFAFRQIPSRISAQEDLTPKFSNLRLPLVVACFLLISVTAFSLSKGFSGEKTYYYENGSVLSQGTYLNGKENGLWTYYHENGEKLLLAHYAAGIEKGAWLWYYDTGVLMRKGYYTNGLFDSTWLNYNEAGILVDSSNYVLGRQHGAYKSFHDNGQLYEVGAYDRDLKVGDWTIFYENGNLNSAGAFVEGEISGLWRFNNPDGTPSQEVEYLENEKASIRSLWGLAGEALITNGTGTYILYAEDGKILREGRIENGIKVGSWTSYYPDGTTKEVGEYNNDLYTIKSAFTKQGKMMVQNGTGKYTAYFDGTDLLSEKGQYKNGLREGTWVVYYPNGIAIQQEIAYKNGKLNGRNVTYFSDGNIFAEGDFEADKKVGLWHWYYESGQLESTVTFAQDKKQGDQIFWSESGREAKKEVYDKGELVSETLL